jgi:multidrug resistance efflux pump
MPENEKSSGNSTGVREENKTEGDQVGRITKTVLIICLSVFIWYILADRFAPFTEQARTKVIVIPVIPRVSGYLTEIGVEQHKFVSAGQKLFQIDRKPYELAVKKAEAHLDYVTQQVAALTATVKSAAGRVGSVKAQLDRAQRNYRRTEEVLKKNPGALSQADIDRSETGLNQAYEKLVSAEADLEKAKQQLGISGPENAQVKEALVQLEQANYDLEMTAVLAPSDGVADNFYLDKGYYAAAGKALAVFIPSGKVWIQADYRENNLGNIDPGDEAEFTLDIAPGRIFGGRVRSIGYGVNPGEKNDRGTLPTVSSSQSWLRDPQRFPVIIEITDREALRFIRSGGQADVIVYAGNSFILNTIGWLQIRISSWFSYVR